MIEFLRGFYYTLVLFPIALLFAELPFCYGMKKRRLWRLTFVVSLAAQVFLTMLIYYIGSVTDNSDILSGILNTTFFVALNLATMFLMCKGDPREILMRFIGAHVLQNVGYNAASLIWEAVGLVTSDFQILFILYGVYAVLYTAAFIVGRRYLKREISHVSAFAVVVAAIVFYLKDFIVNTELEKVFGIVGDVLIFVVLYGIIHQDDLNNKINSLEYVLQEEYRQHEMTKESIDIINRKCHDLKHRLLALDAASPDDFYREVEASVRIYDSSVKTGNETLDVVLMQKLLICEQYKVDFTYLADGAALKFMSAADIATLFGNILDNALDYLKTVPEQARRLILKVAEKGGQVCIHSENTLLTELKIKDGLPVTTKQDKNYHGFGMQSIKYTVSQYGGVMNINTDNQTFTINCLLPVK